MRKRLFILLFFMSVRTKKSLFILFQKMNPGFNYSIFVQIIFTAK